MDPIDQIWNHAIDLGVEDEVPEGTPAGLAALAHLLRVFNSTMGGGLLFAFEVNEEFRIRRAIAAARYFGLTELATFWEDLLLHIDEHRYLGSKYDAYCDLIAGGDAIEAAFRAKLLAAPEDFEA